MAGTDDVHQALRDLKPGCDKAVIEHARDVIETLWSFYQTLSPQIDRAQTLAHGLPFSASGQVFDAVMDAYERCSKQAADTENTDG